METDLGFIFEGLQDEVDDLQTRLKQLHREGVELRFEIELVDSVQECIKEFKEEASGLGSIELLAFTDNL